MTQAPRHWIFCTAILVTAIGLACPSDGPSTPKRYVPPGHGDGPVHDGRSATDGSGGGDKPGDPTMPGDKPPEVWSCNPIYYGTDDGCDCGCTIADPDCAGFGCVQPTCAAAACDFCWDADAMLSCAASDGGSPAGD